MNLVKNFSVYWNVEFEMSAFEMDLIWYPRAFTIIITDYSILFLFLSEEIEENHTSGKKNIIFF